MTVWSIWLFARAHDHNLKLLASGQRTDLEVMRSYLWCWSHPQIFDRSFDLAPSVFPSKEWGLKDWFVSWWQKWITYWDKGTLWAGLFGQGCSLVLKLGMVLFFTCSWDMLGNKSHVMMLYHGIRSMNKEVFILYLYPEILQSCVLHGQSYFTLSRRTQGILQCSEVFAKQRITKSLGSMKDFWS